MNEKFNDILDLETQKILEAFIDFFRDTIDSIENEVRSSWDFFNYIKNEEEEIIEAMKNEDEENMKEEICDFIVMKIRFLLSNKTKNLSTFDLIETLLQDKEVCKYIEEVSARDFEKTQEKFYNRYSFLQDENLSTYLQNKLKPKSRKLVIESLYYWRKSTEKNRTKIPKISESDFPISKFSVPEKMNSHFYECISVLAQNGKSSGEAFCLGILLFGGKEDFKKGIGETFPVEYRDFLEKFFSCSHIYEDEYIFFFEYKQLYDFTQKLPMEDLGALMTKICFYCDHCHISLQNALAEITKDSLRENCDIFIEMLSRIQKLGKTARSQISDFERKFLSVLQKS